MIYQKTDTRQTLSILDEAFSWQFSMILCYITKDLNNNLNKREDLKLYVEVKPTAPEKTLNKEERMETSN